MPRQIKFIKFHMSYSGEGEYHEHLNKYHERSIINANKNSRDMQN